MKNMELSSNTTFSILKKKLGLMALSLLQNVIEPWYKNTFAMYIPKKWACLHNKDILVCPKMVSDLHRKINGLDMPQNIKWQ